MDIIIPLLIIFGIVGVGSYGFYKHAVKHTDGTDDIQTADSGQKGLMSSSHATDLGNVKTDLDVAEAKLATIETNAKDDQTGAEIKALLEALTGANRLVATAIQHLDNLGITPTAAQWGFVGALTADPLGGDAAGRILRNAHLKIDDGTVDATLKCTLTADWNGDTIAETDNIAKGGITGNFGLDAAGQQLTIEAAGLSGNVLAVLGTLSSNASGVDLTGWFDILANDIRTILKNPTTGVSQDITTLVNTGSFFIYLFYITDA